MAKPIWAILSGPMLSMLSGECESLRALFASAAAAHRLLVGTVPGAEHPVTAAWPVALPPFFSHVFEIPMAKVDILKKVAEKNA